jgi:hypothetical protein
MCQPFLGERFKAGRDQLCCLVIDYDNEDSQGGRQTGWLRSRRRL